MKTGTRLFNLLSALFIIFLFPVACQAAGTRQPAWAGIFYPADKDELQTTIAELTNQARPERIKPRPAARLRALVLPHAGYAYSGSTAAHAALALENQDINKVVLMGTDHRIGFSGIGLTDYDAYESPLGRVNIHPDTALLRRHPELFQSRPQADRGEHSLEVPLPFFQDMLPDFTLVPLVFGSLVDPDQAVTALMPLLDDKTLLVASSDLSHYLDYDTARTRDKETIDMVLNLDSSGLKSYANRACGAIPIAVIIELAKKHNWQPVLLHYENSGDTATRTKDRVVGYGALAFYGDKAMENKNFFSSDQGQALVKLARQSIRTRFTPGNDGEQRISGLDDPAFREERGTFVTLKIAGQLRGCIGTISGHEPVIEGVRRNALNAAFNDFRFRPLREEELSKISIEVSILSEPHPLDYEDGDDLLTKLRPGTDGVILRLGRNSATFLPQVWEQLPETDKFLAHLCSKAGLSADAWRTQKPEIEIYQVQYFNEK